MQVSTKEAGWTGLANRCLPDAWWQAIACASENVFVAWKVRTFGVELYCISVSGICGDK